MSKDKFKTELKQMIHELIIDIEKDEGTQVKDIIIVYDKETDELLIEMTQIWG